MNDVTTIDAAARRRILATVSHTAPFMQAAPSPPAPDPAALRERLLVDREATVRGMEEIAGRLRAGRSGWGAAGQRGRARWL